MFCISPYTGWTVNSDSFYYVDEYGDAIPERASGANWIPEHKLAEYGALCLVEVTGLSYRELCQMPYDEYYELSCLARAKAWTPQTKDKRLKYL